MWATTSSCVLVMTEANQPIPQSLQNSILLATYPCMKDGPREGSSMIGPWAKDITELIENGVTMKGRKRAVGLLFNGDSAVLTTFFRGYEGAICRMSCFLCLVVGRPSTTSNAEAALYGSMQLMLEEPRMWNKC